MSIDLSFSVIKRSPVVQAATCRSQGVIRLNVRFPDDCDYFGSRASIVHARVATALPEGSGTLLHLSPAVPTFSARLSYDFDLPATLIVLGFG